MAKLLLSADVILEAILNRTPLVESAEIWFQSEFIKRSVLEEVVEVYLPEISRDVIYFILSSKNEQKAKEYISFILSEYKVCLTTDDDFENKVFKNIYREKNNILRGRILTSYEKEYAKKNGYYYVTLEPLYPYVIKDVSRVITPQMLADSLAIVEAFCDCDVSNNAAPQTPQALRVVEKTRLRTQRRETLRQILDNKLNDQLLIDNKLNDNSNTNSEKKLTMLAGGAGVPGGVLASSWGASSLLASGALPFVGALPLLAFALRRIWTDGGNGSKQP
ncbi:hypothetical protein BZZ01_04845 [Nostocales cyanobacterium HT-58-2]|nr:hypothetical protein BZZ01_04845 [Nostocales cyanobacterium HT-58-2]